MPFVGFVVVGTVLVTVPSSGTTSTVTVVT